MLKVSNSSTFHVKILESHWWTNAAGPCLDTRYESLCLFRNVATGGGFGRTAGRLNLLNWTSVCNIVRVGVCICLY